MKDAYNEICRLADMGMSGDSIRRMYFNPYAYGGSDPLPPVESADDDEEGISW